MRVSGVVLTAAVSQLFCYSKSTAIQLIECFYRPTDGAVKYKGVDLKDMNTLWLRDQVGLVSQQPTLFDCSIEENIKYACPEATHEQVVEAAKQANADSFITAFPNGYATQVGQGSTLISGGTTVFFAKGSSHRF